MAAMVQPVTIWAIEGNTRMDDDDTKMIKSKITLTCDTFLRINMGVVVSVTYISIPIHLKSIRNADLPSLC